MLPEKWKEIHGLEKKNSSFNRGATTSKAHTAVKIAPFIRSSNLGSDASRSVPVAQSLTGDSKEKITT